MSSNAAAAAMPEAVASAAVDEFPFNDAEYAELRKHYLEKRVRHDAELPNGFRLRKQTVSAAIEANTPGYIALRKEIDHLEKEDNHEQVYRLLKRLATWEQKRAGPFPIVGRRRRSNSRDDDVIEVVDLTSDDNDNHEIINVDTFILDVLLVKVIKAEEGATPLDSQGRGEHLQAATKIKKEDEQAPASATDGDIPLEDEKISPIYNDKHLEATTTEDDKAPSPAKDKNEQHPAPATNGKPQSVGMNKKGASAAIEEPRDGNQHPAVMSESNLEQAAPRNGNAPFPVEFKFSSMCSYVIDNEVKGVFYMPLLQDQESGLFTVPNGEHDVKGTLHYGFDYHSNEGDSFDFTGHLKRDKNGRASLTFNLTFKTIYGDSCLVTADDEKMKLHTLALADHSDSDEDEPEKATDLQEWAGKAGGTIAFHFQNDGGSEDELLLYTVLSENQPFYQQTQQERETGEPNWGKLETCLLSRDDSWSQEEAKKGVEEYKKFLKLKILNNDWNSELFAPSPKVDKVWHAHLSFNKQYLHDVQLFAQQLLKEGALVDSNVINIVKHCPCLWEESRDRYLKTHRSLEEESLREESHLDPDFWPSPTSLFPQEPVLKRNKVWNIGCC